MCVYVQGVLVGDECMERAHELDLSYPIAHGLVQSWEDMLHVWDHTFGRVLGLDATARARSRILLTEPPLNPLANRRRLVQVMFERYGFAGVQVQVQAVLTLYAQGACAPRGSASASLAALPWLNCSQLGPPLNNSLQAPL